MVALSGFQAEIALSPTGSWALYDNGNDEHGKALKRDLFIVKKGLNCCANELAGFSNVISPRFITPTPDQLAFLSCAKLNPYQVEKDHD